MLQFLQLAGYGWRDNGRFFGPLTDGGASDENLGRTEDKQEAMLRTPDAPMGMMDVDLKEPLQKLGDKTKTSWSMLFRCLSFECLSEASIPRASRIWSW